MHQELVNVVREHLQIRSLRLSIVDTNADVAEPFWVNLGYEPTGKTKPYASRDVASVTQIRSRSA